MPGLADVGIVHQQRQIRDRTIDARPNEPSEVAFADGLARLEVRIARLEVLVTQLSREALRDALTPSPVTRDTTRDGQGDAVTVTRDTTRRHAHAERQRRYRERKKHGADTER
jgi:hypothetical protein